MIRIKTFFFLLLFTMFISSCIGRIPVNEPEDGFWKNEPVVFDKSYDVVWDAVLQAANEVNWDIAWSDRPTGTIKFTPTYVYNTSFGKQFARVIQEPTNKQVENSKMMGYLKRVSYFEKATPKQAPPHPLYTHEKLIIKVKPIDGNKTKVKANYTIIPYFDYKIGHLGGVKSKGTLENALYSRVGELMTEDISPPPPPEMKEIYELADIFFDFDKSHIRDDAVPVLMQNANTLRDNPNLTIVIHGYADIRGSDGYNIRLGKRRALATKNYLASLGIDPRRIIAISKGETIKFAPGSTESEYQLNRRAHIIPVDPKAPVIYPE